MNEKDALKMGAVPSVAELCEAIALSIHEHDFEATSALMRRLAVRDPVAAQAIFDFTRLTAELTGESETAPPNPVPVQTQEEK